MTKYEKGQKGFKVNERWRIIVFDSGEKLTLHNVTYVDQSSNYLRMDCDEGRIMVNSDRVLFIRFPSEAVVR